MFVDRLGNRLLEDVTNRFTHYTSTQVTQLTFVASALPSKLSRLIEGAA